MIAGLPLVALLLSCSPDTPTDPGQTQGQIQVNVNTTGTGQPASFTVRLDGGSPRTVTPNGSVTYSSLTTGNYDVELVVPANCTVGGSSTRTVGVQEAATATASFSVTCSAVPTGAIGVTTSTTGTPVDPDGYSVSVDGGPGQSIGVNGTRLIADLPVGEHSVGLSGVADNCMVQGANPRTVDVSEGQTTQTQFEVVCSATTGLLEVTVSTTGLEFDPDGYTVNLDGSASQAVGANATTTFTGVQEGSHTVTLEDVAPNCTVDSENPTSADVTAGETTVVGFSVSCVATVGAIQVSTTTNGAQQDADGYAISVDGSPGQSIGINGTTTITGLGPGAHDVELLDVAGNCAVAGDNPRSVDVIVGATSSTTFDVTCSSTVGGIDVTISTTGDAIDADGYSLVLDGGADTELVDPNDTASFTGLAPGDHSLSLQNVADNCTVTSTNPVTANVTAGATTDVSFTVVCQELTGSIQVNMSTSGSNQDANGYTLSLDGGTGQSVGSNGSFTFSNVVIGPHQLTVSGVASNCSVQGSNPRTVTVNENQTTQVDVSVVCAATTGQIQVTVTTTGDDLDADGYTVSRGTVTQPVATNGSTTFTGVPTGNHTLTLQNIAGNCTVTSPNPTSVNVTAGATANASFTVECTRTTGDIRAIASTSGSPPDADGYDVAVDGGTPQALAVNGNVLFADLQPGSHSVTISDIAPQCTLTGNATRSVTVNANAVTDVTFIVTCDPLEGDIQVDVSTSGADPDPDGYDVLLDGGSSRSVGVNGSTTYTNVSTGSHQVSLTDVAGNCTVGGTNPRSVTVVDEQTAVVSFSVTCVTTTGSVEVAVATSGDDLDVDGYTLTLVGHGSQNVGVNGTVTFTSVTAGTRTVNISGLAGNCTDDDGDGTEQTNVTAGNTANVSFEITCAGLTGSLEVTTSTTGDDPDTDYFVEIDGGAPQAIGANTTVAFPGLADGDHDVELTGVAGNCTVGGSNPRTVNVPANGTATTTFSVTCAALLGDLDVVTSTSGDDPDADGYDVVIDGGAPLPIAINTTQTFPDLDDGDHDVQLADVASNCDVAGDNPRTVSVPAGGSITTTFTVTCTLTTGSILVSTTSTGLTSDLDLDGYLVDVDGGAPMPIGVNDSHTFTGVAPGVRTVTLSDIDGLCEATSANPLTPTVAAGMTATADFAVSCV